MWTTVGLVVALVACANAFNPGASQETVTAFRLKSQNLHVDYIASQLDSLESQLNSLSAPIDQASVTNLKARIRNLEGNKCPPKQVSCGGDWPECVHHLLVCDGQKDCHNGRDEDEKICDGSVVAPGSSFRGIVHWHSCVQAADHYSTITITAVRRSPFFTNRTFLRATVTRVYDDRNITSYKAIGYFVYAARKLVILAEPGSPQRFATVCTFNFGDNDHGACKVVQESSQQECGLARLNRV